jgi:MucR family transcriptional regulator, transcriptional regulator of exopolysaccharide biosynthesis
MSDSEIDTIDAPELLKMTADIVSAYVSNNVVENSQLAEVIRCIHDSLSSLHKGGLVNNVSLKPAVSVRKSIGDDYLICLEDGKRLKMLKRYLRSNYGMTPEEYRMKWSLPSDYPMVAPAYAKQRSAFAKQIGLGRKPKK